MIGPKTRIGLLTLAFLLTLFLPWPGALIPALVLCILAPVQCTGAIREPWDNPDWTYSPPNADVLRMKGVCLDPWLFIGDRRITAEIRLPFEASTAERFRSKPGAMALSAAIALTDDCAAQQEGSIFTSAEEIRRWERAMGIVPENFKTRNPRLDDAKYRGYRGVVVRDGEGERAYFVGDAGISQICSMILDGTPRVMTKPDLEQLHLHVPAQSLCYVTATVTEGRLSDLCYLGSVLPAQSSLPSREAVESGMALNDRGYGIMLNGNAGLTLQVVQNMGIEWPEDNGDRRYIELIPRHGEEEQPRDFDAAVASLQHHALRERNKQLLAAMLGLLLWPCATLCSAQWPLLLGLGCLCASILFCRNIPFPADSASSLRRYWVPLIPGLVLPLAVALFLPQMEQQDAAAVGVFMLMATAGVVSFWIPWRVRNIQALATRLKLGGSRHAWVERIRKAVTDFVSRGSRTIVQTAVCWVVASAAMWLITQKSLLAVLFGLVAGLLSGMAVHLAYDWAEHR